MNSLEAALADLSGFLRETRTPYMVVGGFANLRWGRRRLTEDLDVTIMVADAALPAFVEQLRKRFRLLAPDPLAFARETRVIPVATPAQVRVDLILAGLAFEEAAIRRAMTVTVGSVEARICTAEDLVLHKLASERPRDAEDVEGIVVRQGAALDRSYLDPLVRQLAEGLEQPAIVDFYSSCLRKAGVA